jgi:hypothetical protein
MAEKHKSKYKKPENAKPKYRKDIKDYTLDDKDEKLNPYATGDKIKNVLRKTDKEVVDTGDLYVKYKADDRLYKDVETGEYDPKHAAKVLKKRQDDDEKLSKDQIKDKIENLTREGKERLVREYFSRKIHKQLQEQAEEPAPTEEPAPAEDPIAAADPSATSDPLAGMATPAPDASAPPEAPAADTTTAPETTPAEKATPESTYSGALKEKNTIEKVGSLTHVIKDMIIDAEPEVQQHFYKSLFGALIKQRNKLELQKNVE